MILKITPIIYKHSLLTRTHPKLVQQTIHNKKTAHSAGPLAYVVVHLDSLINRTPASSHFRKSPNENRTRFGVKWYKPGARLRELIDLVLEVNDDLLVLLAQQVGRLLALQVHILEELSELR